VLIEVLTPADQAKSLIHVVGNISAIAKGFEMIAERGVGW